MSTVRRVTKNAVLLITSNIIGKAITFFYIVVAARYLGVDNFGALSFAIAFTSIFSIIEDLGLAELQIREIARDKAEACKITTNILFLKVLLGVVAFLLMAVIINFLNYSQEVVLVVYLLGISVVLNNFRISLEAVSQGFEDMSYMAIAHILNSLLLASGAIFITQIKGGLIEFGFLYVFLNIVLVVFDLIVTIKKFTSLDKKMDIKFCKYLLSEAWPFAISNIFIIVYLRFDSVLLSIFIGERAVGLYNAPYKLVDSLNMIYYSFIVALYPATSRLFKYSREKLKFSFDRSLKYLLLVSLPIAVGVTLLSGKIIDLVYGTEYAPSVIVLQILIWSTALGFVNMVLSNLLYSINKQIVVTKQNALAALVNLLSNFILIPPYSYIGASLATFVTQLSSLPYLYLSISKTEFKLSKKVFFVLFSKLAFASLLMGVFIMYLKSISIFIVIPLSAVLYFCLIYLLSVIDTEDIELVQKMVGGFFVPFIKKK